MRDALQATPRWGSRSSRIGIWTGLAGIALVGLASAAARTGSLPGTTGLAAYLAGSALLLVALLSAGFGLLRSGGNAGTASAPATWLALLAGLAVTANNAVLLGQARAAPAIHDISTDTDNPPAFVALLPVRAATASNPPAYSGPAAAAAQKSAYPDLQPVYFPRPANQVFAAARAAVDDQGWALVAADEAEGRLEASARDGWPGLEGDVVIRVQPGRDQTRVDVRSKSRSGTGDLGTNARRVRDYLAALQARLAR